jgi:hypothetical protein
MTRRTKIIALIITAPITLPVFLVVIAARVIWIGIFGWLRIARALIKDKGNTNELPR